MSAPRVPPAVVDRHDWAQYPSPGRDRARGAAQGPAALVVSAIGALAVAGLAPLWWVRISTHADAAGAVALVVVAGSLALVATWARPERWAVPVVVVGVGAAAGAVGGSGTAVWWVVAATTASWIVGDRPPPWIVDGAAARAVRRVPRAAAPAATGAQVAVVLLAVQLIDRIEIVAFGVPLLLLAAAGAAAWAPRPFEAVAAAVPVVAGRAAEVVVRLLMLVAALVVVLVPWAAQRVIRWDPTWAPRRRWSSWIERSPLPADDRQLWAPDPRLRRSTSGRRRHRIVVAAGVVVVALLGTGLVTWAQQEAEDARRFGVPALSTSPWWPDLEHALNVAYGRSEITSYVGVVMPDMAFPGMNVTDGVRSSWRPPVPATCRPVRVWMFGGSTMFGLGQRDAHTIASQLARAAWQDGIALDVSNLGVPADTRWMEERRLELRLAAGEPPPDLVVFYDGVNDLRVQNVLNSLGLGGRRPFANDLDGDALLDIESQQRGLTRLLALTGRNPEVREPAERRLDDAAVGEFAARSYGLAVEHGARLTPDVDRVTFVQPSRVTRRPVVAADGGSGDSERRQSAAFFDHLPSGVVDLSGALDGDRRPVYYDEVHTNELGARLVADAMYTSLRDRLSSLADEGSGSRASCG